MGKAKVKNVDVPQNRLVTRALALGMLSNEQPHSTNTLPISKGLVKANGMDIIKKSSSRKNRYLIVMNCLLAPAASGRLGTLAQLDSNSPVMYMDFPLGRLKLFGTLVFPKNKYLVLKTGSSAGVFCEDVFENMIVFSEAWWVGRKEDNPEEERLQMPAELITTDLHKSYTFGYGAGDTGKGEDIPGGSQRPGGGGGMEGMGSQMVVEEEGGTQQETPLPGSAARPRRAAAVRSYRDANSDEEAGEEGEEDEDDNKPRAAQGMLAGGGGGGRARTVRSIKAASISLGSDEEVEGDGEPGMVGSQPLATPARPPAKRAAAKRKYKDDSEEEEDGTELESEEEEESEEESDVSGSEYSGRKPRKPAATTPRKTPTGGKVTPKAAKTKPARPSSAGRAAAKKASKVVSREEDSEGGDADSDHDGDSNQEGADVDEGVRVPAKRPSRLPRSASAKKPRYIVDDDSEEGKEEGSDGDGGDGSDEDEGSEGGSGEEWASEDASDGGGPDRKRNTPAKKPTAASKSKAASTAKAGASKGRSPAGRGAGGRGRGRGAAAGRGRAGRKRINSDTDADDDDESVIEISDSD